MRFRTITSAGLVLLIAGVVLGMQINASITSGETFEALRKLEAAFLTISERYVENVDTANLSEQAIEAMLRDLDPHSVYIDAEQMRSVQEDFNASFDGIGISYEFIEGTDGRDTLTVLSPVSGGPSDSAGIMSGDRIIRVDGEDAVGFKTADVERTLKGRRGTTVIVTVLRPGGDDVMDIEITRDRIPIHTLDAAYMVDDRTGYIRLNRFARTTYDEFVGAMTRLKGEGMTRLVFDLRDNAGGFMDMAIRISDEFLGGGAEIVTARSRHAEYRQSNEARSGGLFERGAVIVLINERSASASEIVAGALQDHDRALVVGRRSFGKGLVQKQFMLADNSALRMTISRFYTPSGRLIQTPYENGVREEYYRDKYEKLRNEAALSTQEIIDLVPDSLKYQTAQGRVVFGGGGILPDYIVYTDTLSALMRAIRGRNLDQYFARGWLDRNGENLRAHYSARPEAFIREFEVSDEMLTQFRTFLVEHNVEIGE
ncbi:MAG: S41 family peptidase, partial [Bacteroidota bacterium]